MAVATSCWQQWQRYNSETDYTGRVTIVRKRREYKLFLLPRYKIERRSSWCCSHSVRSLKGRLENVVKKRYSCIHSSSWPAYSELVIDAYNLPVPYEYRIFVLGADSTSGSTLKTHTGV